jgi:hypothetical protein
LSASESSSGPTARDYDVMLALSVQKMRGETCDIGHSPRRNKLASVFLRFGMPPNRLVLLKFESTDAKTTGTFVFRVAV